MSAFILKFPGPKSMLPLAGLLTLITCCLIGAGCFLNNLMSSYKQGALNLQTERSNINRTMILFCSGYFV